MLKLKAITLFGVILVGLIDVALGQTTTLTGELLFQREARREEMPIKNPRYVSYSLNELPFTYLGELGLASIEEEVFSKFMHIVNLDLSAVTICPTYLEVHLNTLLI